MGLTGTWLPGERRVSWDGPSGSVVKTFRQPPRSVLISDDEQCVVVVEEDGRLDNAVVYDVAGNEVVRLRPPEGVGEAHWRIGYHVVYESEGRIVAVFATQVGDWWGVPDLTTGELRELSEWR